MAGFGLRQGRSQGMDGYTGNLIEFPIDPANTNPMFRGDPVVLDAAGFVEEASGATPGTVTGPILGTFAGWRDKASEARIGGNDNPFAPYWSGAPNITAPVAHVVMPPHTLFYVKGDSTIDWTAEVIGGSRRDFIYAAGDPRTADSRVTLGAATATGAMLVQRLADMPGNALSNDEPIFEVAVVAQQATFADAV